MNFKIGDKVSFVNDVGEAEVISLQGEYLVVRDEFGFDISLPKKEVVKMIDTHHTFNAIDAQAKIDDDGKSRYPIRKKSSDLIWEVDLHIQEIIDTENHLTNYEMVQLQLSSFEKAFAQAIGQKMRRVVFIHGVGEGVLKSEIRNLLDQVDNCEYRDADYWRYGQGATEVSLWYN